MSVTSFSLRYFTLMMWGISNPFHHREYQRFLPSIWCSLLYTLNANLENLHPKASSKRIICAEKLRFQSAKSCGFFFSFCPSKSRVLAKVLRCYGYSIRHNSFLLVVGKHIKIKPNHCFVGKSSIN